MKYENLIKGNEDLMFYSIDSFNEHIGGVIDDKE